MSLLVLPSFKATVTDTQGPSSLPILDYINSDRVTACVTAGSSELYIDRQYEQISTAEISTNALIRPRRSCMCSHDPRNGHIRHGWFFILIKYDLFDHNLFVSYMRSRASKPTREPPKFGGFGCMCSPDLRNGHIRHGWFFELIKYDLFDRNPFVSQVRSRAKKPRRGWPKFGGFGCMYSLDHHDQRL